MKNVVLLTIDTLRRDVLGCYGNKDGLTPFIDSIQDKCIRFTKAQTVAPYTQASFPGILTSSYFFDHEKSQKLSPKRTLVSEPLKKAGIRTAGFHSNPYLCGFFGWNRGWDKFYDSMQDQVSDIAPYIKGDMVNKKIDDWLTSSNSNDAKPLFLWAHYMDVHEPYVPAKKYLEKVDASINMTEQEMFELFKAVLLPRDISKPETVTLLKKLYDAHVIEVDEYTRQFFDILKKHNILDDSVVIITTDHGDEFGEHSSLSHDGKMYDELVGSPLLIYDSSLAESKTCDSLVSGLDISPTILQLFGLEPESNFQGQSLLPLESYEQNGCFGEAIGKLSHKVKETDRPAYFYRKNGLKITYRVEDDRWEMYDLKEDAQEQNNIIGDSPLADEMKNKLNSRINRKTL